MTLSRLGDIATIVLALCAVVITGLVVRKELRTDAPRPREPREIAGWETMAGSGHRMGPEDAAITILEFSDFQCPFCARVQHALETVRARHPDDVAIVYRHLPLEAIHPWARAAANAAECAAEQGRFREMHDALFAAQEEIGATPFEEFSRRARVEDVAGFTRCLDDRRYDQRVAADAGTARRAGLDGTPSIIINGTLLPGTPTADELLRMADSLLATPPAVATP